MAHLRLLSHGGAQPLPVIVVADRLPGVVTDGSFVGASGLPDDPVTDALRALVTRLNGGWVGRPPASTSSTEQAGTCGVRLDPRDITGYEHQADSCVWPLYHDMTTSASFDGRWREAYRRANMTYAAAVAQQAAPGGSVWVHGHQLQLVPARLRHLRHDVRIGFFLQSPFPSPDLARRMPMWREIAESLLSADHLGFQDLRSAENFLRLAGPEIEVLPTVGVHPTAVDTARLTELSLSAATARRAEELRRQLGSPGTVVLSIDSHDGAQGTEQRLQVLESMFHDGQLRAGETVIVQVLAGGNDRSRDLRDRIAQRVARINGQFARVGRPCVHSVVASPPIDERAALYYLADLMLTTPFREAATPFALEFVVSARPEAALVLSQFSGTADVLPDAFVVNPHDSESLARTVSQVLNLARPELARRLRRMRTYPASYDHHAWARGFLLSMHTNREWARWPSDGANGLHWPVQPDSTADTDDDWLVSDA